MYMRACVFVRACEAEAERRIDIEKERGSPYRRNGSIINEDKERGLRLDHVLSHPSLSTCCVLILPLLFCRPANAAEAGLWKGILPNGKVGLFKASDATACQQLTPSHKQPKSVVTRKGQYMCYVSLCGL